MTELPLTMIFSISDAIKLLDPTSILGQFQPDVRTTLQSQMCTVPNIDNRIVSANDLLRQLVDADTAKLMNHINEKLPMYLSFLPGKLFFIDPKFKFPTSKSTNF